MSKLNIMLTFIFSVFFVNPLHADYYCTTDSGYVNFITGVTSSLSGTPSYSSVANCESNCKTYKPCETKTATKHLEPITGSIKLSEADKISFEGLLAPEKLSSILIVSNGNAGTYDFSTTPINGSLFKFPSMPTNVLDPIAVSTIWSNGGNSISLKSVLEVTNYAATCNSGDNLQGLQCYHVNSSYAIPSDGNCTNGDYKTTTLCEKRTYYSPKCNTGDTLSASMCYHLTGNKYYQVGATYNGVTLDMPTTSTFKDPLTDQTFNSSFYFSAEANYSGYTCKALKGQITAGDYNNNFFSSQSTCETYCVIQKDCTSVGNATVGCDVTDTQYSNPVTDYTGKTVYTQVFQSQKCTTKTTEQTGCDAYKITNAYNEVKYDTSSIGWRYSTYSGLEEASTSILMTEQMQHIFSGWKGKCEYGKMFNNPFNDPMKILSYAMMAYSAASKAMSSTETATSAATKTDAYNAAADSTSSSYTQAEAQLQTTSGATGEGAITASNSVNDATVYGSTIQGAESMQSASEYLANVPGETLLDKIQRINTAWTNNVGGVQLTLKWSSIAEAAISLAYPPKEDYTSADKLMKSWMGSGDQDAASLAYVQCMASIGLSFPNLASWSAGDKVGSSPELLTPTQNPLRLTDNQVSILIAATSEKFVKTTLMPISVNSDSMTYIALTSLTYYQVGQVLCGGKLAIAQNISVAQATPAPSSGGANTGMVAAKMAISMLPPPYNLVASLVLDIVTSFESGNACTDQEIAIKWGTDQFKTNQHLNFGQCHYISTNCAAKWFWGKCMRQRNNYCCYDQITTRVMMEGIKPQLGKDWSSCNDISINDLKNISFQPCAPNQDPYLDKCFPLDKFNEFQTEITKQASKGLGSQSMQDVVDQAVNSMAISGKNLSEICKDCNK